MITYKTIAVIENQNFGEVDVYLNDKGEIVFDPNDDQFVIVMDKAEWEEIKAFVDEKFKDAEEASQDEA